MSEWLRERTLALIEAFHSKECLWKATSSDYTNRPVKIAAWEEVAKAANCDVRSAEKKMKSLRTQFMYIHKEALRNGSGRDGVLQPKWFAYNALKFLVLDKHSNSRLNAASLRKRPYFEERISGDDHYIGQCIEESSISNSQGNGEIFMTPNGINSRHDLHANRTSITPILTKQKGDHLDSTSEGVCNIMNVVSRQTGRDEFVVFAEHVAHRLRKISDPHARLVAQHQINNVLFEAEMATFKSSVSHSNVATNTETVSHNSSYYNNLETSEDQSNIIIIEDEECDVKQFI